MKIKNNYMCVLLITYIVDEKIIFRDVEKKLIKIITEMSYQKGRSTKFSIIAAYAYVRENVTQSTLQDLTGFSNGLLKILSDLTHGQKKYIPEAMTF